jgi:hypothetical protein
VQLVLGVEHATTTHVILHDADAIILKPDFFDAHYRAARDTGAVATGVHPLWDAWLRQYRPDLVATWEMCAQASWLRSVPPFRHLAHPMDVGGEQHVVDTTVFAQMRTPPGRLTLHGSDSEFVHFNYVVSTYRKFQAHRGTTFEDSAFRLLFIRLLTEALQVATDNDDLPSLTDLTRGLTPAPGCVVYPAPTAAGDDYAAFRAKLVDGVAVVYGRDSSVLHRLRGAMAPFDAHYRAPATRG